MSSNTSENDLSFSLLNNTDKDGLDGQNENRIDDDSHSKGSDVKHLKKHFPYRIIVSIHARYTHFRHSGFPCISLLLKAI